MIWQNDAVHTPQDCGGAACFKAFRMLESTRHPSGEANTAEQELDVACARQCSAHLWRKVSLREILWSDPGKQRSGYVWIDLNNAAFQWYSVILNMWLITLGFHVFFLPRIWDLTWLWECSFPYWMAGREDASEFGEAQSMLVQARFLVWCLAWCYPFHQRNWRLAGMPLVPHDCQAVAVDPQSLALRASP